MSLIHQLALVRIKGVGSIVAKHLLDYCGSPEEIFRTPKKQLLKIPGVGEYVATSIVQHNVMEEVEKEIAFIEKHKIDVLFWKSENYPEKLIACNDAPVILYYRGNASLNTKRVISVVGTRNATNYGKGICEELIAELGGHDVLVVSGLAYGIDSYAHKACVKNNIPTIGVLGHGLDRIYPASNRNLALDMLRHGGLLTEYSSGTKPDRQNFPSRNRIIAGMADVTIVVEAALKGGALITAEIANTYNRDVCAFPGDIHKPYSNGCNYLIKTNRAHLISSVKDLEYIMNWELSNTVIHNRQLGLDLAMSAVEKSICEVLQETGPIGIDALLYRLKLPQNKLAIILLELEMKGGIIALPGKVYRLP